MIGRNSLAGTALFLSSCFLLPFPAGATPPAPEEEPAAPPSGSHRVELSATTGARLAEATGEGLETLIEWWSETGRNLNIQLQVLLEYRKSDPAEATGAYPLGKPVHQTIPLTEEGFLALERRLMQRLSLESPAEVRETSTWKVFEILADPDFQDEFTRVASLSDRAVFAVVIVIDDHPDLLTPGEVLQLPLRDMPCDREVLGISSPWLCVPENMVRSSTHRVQEGDTLDSIARQYGVSVEAIQKENNELIFRRFDIHPHANPLGFLKKNRWQSILGSQINLPGPVSSIILGEYGLERRYQGRAESIQSTLLHEVGHIADRNACADVQALTFLDYGPDGKHYYSEILDPYAAFKEGWADYVATHIEGRARDRAEDPPRDLHLEVRGAEGLPFDQRYQSIPADELTAKDLVSNELYVARLLLGLESLSLGRDAVEQAFQRTQRWPCRHIGRIFKALGQVYGGRLAQEKAAMVEAVQAASFDILDEADVETLLEGKLPGGLGPTEDPRPRPRRGSAPAPAPQLPGPDLIETLRELPGRIRLPSFLTGGGTLGQ